MNSRSLPIIVYAAISLLMTWPLAIRLGTHIPIDTGSDVWVHVWTHWWLKRALLTWQNPYFTPLLYHPSGVSLTSHNMPWLNFFFWLPFEISLGAVTAHGLLYVLILTFNAYTMYLFASVQLRSRGGALIAGVVFGFWPWMVSQSGHPNMFGIGWLPLALFYMDRSVRGDSWRNSLMAGLFLALLGLARWQLLAASLLLLAVYLAYRFATHPEARSLRSARHVALTGTTTALLVAPFLVPVIVEQLRRPYADDLLIYEPAFSTDLLAYVSPHFRLALWSRLAAHLPAAMQFPQQEVNYVGYSVLLLAMAGLWRYRAKMLLWVALLVVVVVLALGPVITIGHVELPWVPTPYRLLENLTVNRLLRKPDRYNVFLALPAGMLAGAGAMSLLRRTRSRKRVLLLTTLCVIIVVDYAMFPHPLGEPATPQWYQRLAGDPGDYAILGIPIGSRLADKFYMAYQTENGKPIVGGHVSRPPRESIFFMHASPFLNDMLWRREMDPKKTDVSHQLQDLAVAGIRYLVLHPKLAREGEIQAWRDWLTYEPAYEDDEVIVYATSPRLGVDYSLPYTMTGAIGIIAAEASARDLTQGDLLAIDVRWGTASRPHCRYHLCTQFLNAARMIAQQHCLPIHEQRPTETWEENEVLRGEYITRVDPFLPPGDYAVQLRLQDAETAELAGLPVVLEAIVVEALPRARQMVTPTFPVNARVGNSILLAGYDLSVGDVIQLTLYWQALERMTEPYKVFVHLVDPATGQLVAQQDAEPRNWTYPTTWWDTGEVVSETITLPLPASCASACLLLTGMYSEERGARLPLRKADGAIYADNALPIPIPAHGGE